MKKQSIHWQEAVGWLSLGFLTILVLTWSDGVKSLAHLWAGTSKPQATINELLIKSSIVFFLWMLAAFKVYKIINRLTYIERFLHLCAWCRRINADGQWLPLEDMFLNRKENEISHSICPDCFQMMTAQLKEMSTSEAGAPSSLPRSKAHVRSRLKSQDTPSTGPFNSAGSLNPKLPASC